MNIIDKQTLLAWCRELHFSEDTRKGLGNIEIRFYIRDDFKELKRIYDTMSRDDAKDISVTYIDFIASPCDCYEYDMELDFSLCEETEEIVITAQFRM